MLYRSTDCLSRAGASVKNLAHSASFQSLEKIAPSKPGTKHLGKVGNNTETNAQIALTATYCAIIDQ